MPHSFDKKVLFRQAEIISLTDSFYKRVQEFYRLQKAGNDRLSYLWQYLASRYHGGLENCLIHPDVKRLKEFLEKLYDSETVHGYDVHGKGIASSDYSTRWEDDAITMCVSIGIMPCFNPQQPNAIITTTEDVVSLIEKHIGFKLDYPCPGRMGYVKVGERKIPWRIIQSVYEYCVMRRLSLWPFDEVLEIGGGTCSLGWLLNRIRRIKYHSIDIPITSVIQAFLLAAALGEDKVWLSGEKKTTDHGVFIHGTKYDELDDVDLDLIFNKDSLPEIPPDVAKEYLDFLIPQLRPGGSFFSINHESSNATPIYSRVFELMQPYHGMKLMHRGLCWNRAGYVDEIWQMQLEERTTI